MVEAGNRFAKRNRWARSRLATDGTVGGDEATGTIEVDGTTGTIEVDETEYFVEYEANGVSIAVRNVTWARSRSSAWLERMPRANTPAHRRVGAVTALAARTKAVAGQRPTMSYTKISLSDTEPRSIEGVEPELRAVGYELRPSKMRPSVWEFAPGESNDRHRQRQQEELYVVLEGRLTMEVEGETVPVTTGDYVVVPPESWRQLTADEASQVLVVGAPNVKDDAIDEEDAQEEE
jgi:quercetin dioxygenase-like cupin family protein